ncbi:MAG: DUF485 domain-containing protein [Phycisphaerales bacterium]|jgi:uncharacterized membrane protein (DUF485 family)|nr:DUF485 domain-containing protein [Phycisphaerales bacterium]MBT7171764.1 DUF485 domain-containing protein [Phycisphaerales bacterium]
MLHEPAAPQGKDYGTAYKTKLGLWMFAIYAVIYIGFVTINLTNAKLMEKPVFLGMNLAVVYGFGLIILALVQALIYNALCTRKEKALKAADTASDTEVQA